MVALLKKDYNTNFCVFSIDTESDLNSLPTKSSPGKDILSTIRSCTQGSIAQSANGKTYRLNGNTNKWELNSNGSGNNSGGDIPDDYKEAIERMNFLEI